MEHIHWIGHAAFKIKTDQTIYIDPYRIRAADDKADVILVTHNHGDHLSPGDIAKIAKPETRIIAPPSCARQLKGKVALIKKGEKLDLGGVTVEAVPAYNLGKPYHPPTGDNVGYILTVGGTRIYHAGDTDFIPEMKTLKVDIALLPCGGTYTMTAREAAEAADTIGAAKAIPMHWGVVVGSRTDAEEFAKACRRCQAVILSPE